MKTYHLPSVPRWGARTFRRLRRHLSSPLKHWRARLPAWKAKS
jgi:hypothetical protein